MVYEYDEINQLIKVDDEVIYLTKVENVVFKTLYESPFKIPVSTDKLYDALYYGYMYRQNNIATVISRLRKKLKDKFEIINVFDVGYYIKPNYIITAAQRYNMPHEEYEED